jgi:excisionase family DNA binding protein
VAVIGSYFEKDARMHTTQHIQRRKLTVPVVAKLLGLAEDKILHWIHTGELRATNLARFAEGRPRFAIDVDDLAAFEKRREVVPDRQGAATW